MSNRHFQVRLKGTQLSNSAKAIQWEFISPHTKLKQVEWIPYSHIDEIHPNEIVISEWIARKIGVN